jgi:tRNA A-37 threonylcarbamoyl transferase component Bud32
MSLNDDPMIGQHLDHILVQQPLGRGGMARIYKGYDTLLKRAVAVKVIDEGHRTSAAYAQRFEREAQAVASLKHPNIVTIYNFGKLDALYYLVMEYIDGADVDTISRNYHSNGELMPHADMLRIVEAVGSALDYAHGRGVIHRDVKPSNIMLERDGRTILTDFGLALRLSEGTIGDTFGSPHYISPEQARNSASAVPQSDLYSLGVVAYELLVGVTPFDDPSATALAMQHILLPVPSPRALNPALSEGVEWVLLKVLAKAPEERYSSGASFVAALRDAVEALRQHPVAVSAPELPPLPPGVALPMPRRLSLQTTLDKVQQELALSQARGQALTRQQLPVAPAPGVPSTARPRARLVLPVVIFIGAVTLLAALAAGVVRSPEAVADSTGTPTESVTVTAEASPTAQTALLATTPPATVETPTADLPTPIPASATSLPPSHTPPPPTPAPPTATPLVATAVVLAPTLMPPSATPTPLPPTVVIPTVAYPDGLLFTLVWDAQTFYVANTSGQRVRSQDISFERVGGSSDRYEGWRWSEFYAWNEPRRCLVLRLPRASITLPAGECPSGYNSDVQAQASEVFWTPIADSDTFRVLWRGAEVGRCQTAAGRCEVRFPRS